MMGASFWLTIPLLRRYFSPSARIRSGLYSGIRTSGPVASMGGPLSDQGSGPRPPIRRSCSSTLSHT